MALHNPAEDRRANARAQPRSRAAATSFPGDDFLEDNPDFAFRAFAPQRGVNFEGAPRSFFNFFQNRQSQLQSEFVAEQGRLAAAGQAPAGSNVDFLRNFPWMQRFLQLTPQQLGAGFAPPA